MHGRRRVSASLASSPEFLEQSAAKAKSYRALLGAVLQASAAKSYLDKQIALSAKLCELNPEAATSWNYRKRATLANHNSESTPIGELPADLRVSVAEAELTVSEAALKRNPKSYCAWYHRRWVLDTWIGKDFAVKPFDAVLERECTLTEQFLSLDPRNFHGWGYRRYLAEFVGETPETELAFSRRLIERDLSNYSAWHHRSAVLPACHGSAAIGGGDAESESRWRGTMGAMSAAATHIPADTLLEEQDLWFQAAVTEPADQAAWVYARWVSGLGSRLEDPEARARVREKDVKQAREVLALEPDATWALVHLANALAAPLDASEADREEARRLYAQLAEVDVDRSGMYEEWARTL